MRADEMLDPVGTPGRRDLYSEVHATTSWFGFAERGDLNGLLL
jgi:hypothetical protein